MLSVVCAIAILAGSVQAQVPKNDDADLRKEVLESIKAAQSALIRQQNNDGSWSGLIGQYEAGVTALAALALINSGVPADDPVIDKAINNLITRVNRGDVKRTYDVSMVIMVLAASHRSDVQGAIARLATRLESTQQSGAEGGCWGYGDERGWWDNSNTQFAVLALREAAYAGVPIDKNVWRKSQEHFLRTQSGNIEGKGGAGWSYQGSGSPTGSMTVAGLASLTITHAMLQDDSDVSPDGKINCCGGDDHEVEKAIDAGARWLSSHFRVTSNPGTNNWLLYYLYGLERAGRFTGHRFFGDHDWYREGASFLVKGQSPRDGTWKSATEKDAVIGTSLALLFLSKGLSPVLINKLKYGPRDNSGDVIGDDWNRHSRDVTNMVNFLSSRDKWPKLLTWQTVDIRKASDGEGVAALLQSPVQYLAGSERLDSIQGRELETLRKYVEQGGFIFAVQNCGSADFDDGIHDLVKRLFNGERELKKLPSTHAVYRSEFVFNKNPPELWGVDFGCRTAIIYAPFDHACRWNKWARHEQRTRHRQVTLQVGKSMQLGTNVIAYATGREVRDKLERPKVLDPAELQRLNRGRLTIARLRHTGGWDTAPNALRRLKAALENIGIETASDTPNLSANDATLFDYPMVYMHGRKNFQYTLEEREKLQAFLENGGFLFADSCCGATQFDESFREMVDQMFGKPMERIPITHDLYQSKLGYDIRKVKRRLPLDSPDASSIDKRETIGEPILEGIQIDGKFVIVYSKYDISCALEQQATTACSGYSSHDAARIGVNLVLYGLFQ